MIASDLLWWILFPLPLGILSVFIAKKFAPEINLIQILGFSAVGTAISCLILSGAFYAGRAGKTHDTEILNGEVLGKTRVHGSYVRTYSCNCVEICSGSGENQSCSEVCQTCTEDHYTVDWDCQTNIGDFKIASKDWTSRRVYKEPDPQRWEIISKGDPVSKSHGYTNYIKAVPETLFRPAEASLKAKYLADLPHYPGDVYDYYRVDRVIPVRLNMPDLKKWNDGLAEILKKLGPQKQANAIIVITKHPHDYFYALQDAWVGAKKNDIVLVIGAPNFPEKAEWVDIMALSQDNLFQVKLRDDILALDSLTSESVLSVLDTDIKTYFKRKSMKDFKYLEAEIDPPAWVMNLTGFLIFLAYAGFWFFMWRASRDTMPSLNRYGIPKFRGRYY